MRLQAGRLAPPFDVEDIQGQRHRLEDYRGKRLLLSFYRYAGCPLCNLRIHELGKKRDLFEQGGLSMLGFFQTPQARLNRKFGKRALPFPVVADPERSVYQRYGVESSWGGLATALVRPAAIKAVASGFLPGRVDGDMALLPADFLIGPDTTIVRSFYAKDAAEHMPMAWIEAFVAGAVEHQLP